MQQYKSRLMAKSSLQKQRNDFDEVYVPVSKHTTLRVITEKRVYFLVWVVDDILVAAGGESALAKVKAHLARKFNVRNPENTKRFFRMELTRNIGHALARYMARPTKAHWQAALDVVPYLARTVEDGRSEETLVNSYNTNYAGDVHTRRSTTGYVFKVYDSRANCSQQWRLGSGS
ncbi:hypothetical protein KFL_014600030 [Klebsormidium nitens]|uniref:Reverse transcriptase Ty1/copia-type domain-containing protein n=1 Tax=Klebsormidium nitens TaxID=105231 RepID=A0A1Y1IX63_KLENI|nr:hypothetical protein KFL_014600030 [Klebsormidium nitens]|eukprot:GAQ93347.1 hypothetical protein KFL_014600030 [Klebsormidium nitens]